MGKTKEQILSEKKTEIETNQMPIRLEMDKLGILKEMICITKPTLEGFGDEQRWETVWDDNQLEILKEKILILVRDL